MGSQQERTERIEALRGLIERLSAPDLTLAEAKVLRSRISDLLEREEAIRFLQETRGLSRKEAAKRVAGLAAELGMR